MDDIRQIFFCRGNLLKARKEFNKITVYSYNSRSLKTLSSFKCFYVASETCGGFFAVV